VILQPSDPLAAVASIVLLLIGLFCLLTRRNPIKQVIGLKIMLQGVTLSLIDAARLHGNTDLGESMVVSALVVEAVTIAVALALIVNVYRHYPSGDIDDMSKLRG
jgi:NADH-quinone oxidoreductase subunit K